MDVSQSLQGDMEQTSPHFAFDIASRLDASTEEVWERISTPTGINDELWPIRMSFPSDAISLNDVERGAEQFQSMVTLGGILPIDRHTFGLEAIRPGRFFHEVSTSWLMKRWVHIRRVEESESGAILRDHIEGTTRIPRLGTILAPIYRSIFARRHRRLRRRFGGREI
jgi:ligand-binding SRPBCC domain-containing protein